MAKPHQDLLAEWGQKPDNCPPKAVRMWGYRRKKLKAQDREEMLMKFPNRPETSRKVHLKERQMYKPWRLEGQISGNLQFFCEIEEKGAA